MDGAVEDDNTTSMTKVSQKGSSAIIELDIAYMDKKTPQQSTTEDLRPLYPTKPQEIQVFRNEYLKSLCLTNRGALYPKSYDSAILCFRIMRRNADMYVGYLLTQKGVRPSELYTPKYLSMWTHCVRVKVRVNLKVGIIFHGFKARLGLGSSVGLHFCVDGFYGVEAFGDAFGNIGTGVCPWMELSGNGSAKSLRLKDGDNIYVNIANQGMHELVQKLRKTRANQQQNTMASAITVGGSQ